MQESMPLFLALLVAHVLGDFLLQTDDMVQGKKAGKTAAFLWHGGVHLACALGVLSLFVPKALAEWKIYPLLGLLVALHLAADFFKERTLAARLADRPRSAFLLDQFLHLVTLLLVVTLFESGLPPWLKAGHALLMKHQVETLWVCAIYVTTIFAGGYLIRVMLPDPPAPQDKKDEADGKEENGEEGEKRIGMYIGWLERFVVVTAILAKSPTAVGLIVAAKSIVRFKRVEKSDAFAEYFLLGTFLSLTLALAGGLALRWLLFGSLDLE